MMRCDYYAQSVVLKWAFVTTMGRFLLRWNDSNIGQVTPQPVLVYKVLGGQQHWADPSCLGRTATLGRLLRSLYWGTKFWEDSNIGQIPPASGGQQNWAGYSAACTGVRNFGRTATLGRSLVPREDSKIGQIPRCARDDSKIEHV
jgi:hypothetical protein